MTTPTNRPTPATSSTARYDAGRAALTSWDNLPAAGTGIIARTRAEAAHKLTAALRALIEPAEVEVTPAEYGKAARDRWVADDHDERNMRELLAAAYADGIQAAWNTWEPDDYAEANS